MKKVFIAFVALTCGVFAVENLLVNGSASGGKAPMGGMEVVAGADGRRCFEMKPSVKVFMSPEFMEVDADGRYVLSVDLRHGEGDCGKVSVGLVPYDAKKNLISYSSLCYAEGSEAVLAEDAEKGATTMVFEGVKDWQGLVKKYYRIIAMDAKDDYSDLPNRNLCYYINAIERDGTKSKVTLNHPIQKAYKAGSKCRLHRDGGYMWAIMEKSKVMFEWRI